MTGPKSLRERLAEGRAALGVVLRGVDTAVAELVGLVGFDFAWIDMEHSAMGFRDVEHLVLALDNRGCVPVVRVRHNEPNAIGQALDLGAEVVVVPHVDTAADAARAVAGAKYFPVGHRGFSSAGRSNRQGMDAITPEAMDGQNRRSMLMVQIESRAAVAGVDEIAAVDGVDILFLGLGDLCQDLGVPGRADDPRCRRAAEAVSRAARATGRIAATVLGDPADLDRWTGLGFRLFCCGVDVLLMRDALTDRLDAFRAER